MASSVMKKAEGRRQKAEGFNVVEVLTPRFLPFSLVVVTLASFLGVELAVPFSAVGQTNTVIEQENPESVQRQEESINGVLDGNSDILQDGSYFQSHTFEGKAGEAITIELSSSEFDAYLILQNPEGETIAKNNDGGEGKDALLTVTLPTSGTYTVIVKSYESEEKGSYQLSWRTASAEELKLLEASQLNQQAIELYEQGKYSEAIPLAERALAIRQEVLGEQHPSFADSLNNLALLYSSQGRYAEAEPLYLQALELTKQLLGEQHPSVATSLNNLALLYSRQGRYAEAEPLYLQALELTKQLLGEQHPSVATSLNNLAALYSSQGRYAEAEPLYLQALELTKQLLGEQHPDLATSLNNLAGLYSRQGRYAEAEPLYLQALELRKQLLGEQHPSVASSLNNLALLYSRQGEYDKVLGLLEAGLEIEEQNLDYNLAAGSESQKRDYLQTISWATNAAISLHLQQVSDNQNAARLALRTILRRKGRILDSLTNTQQILRQRLEPESQKLLDELNATRTQIANLTYNRPPNLPVEEYQKQISSLSQTAKQLEDKISRRSREFRTEFQPVTISAIQKLIPEDTTLVELVQYSAYNAQDGRFGNRRYAAYVLHSQGEPQAVDLGTVEDIEQDLLEFRLALRDKNTDTAQLKQVARRVEEKLMQPVRQLLGSTRQVLLAPDSQLNLIPFEALVDENNRYLVESYTFTYLTSGRDLLRLSILPKSQNSSVLVGNPDFDNKIPGQLVALNENSSSPITRTTRSFDFSSRDIPPLAGTGEEVKAIAAMLGVKPLLSTEATEEAIKQIDSPSVLHIATHGFFESASETQTLQENPLLLSGLLLAGFKNQESSGEDGVLTALEATGLKLYGTQLVVLSACDTGLGTISSSEGIYGLRRALVIAGVQSQLISLWKVEDIATQKLMVAYYQRLKDEQMGRTEALRETQLEMLRGEDYQHPYYWASFIPSGDWSPMVFATENN